MPGPWSWLADFKWMASLSFVSQKFLHEDSILNFEKKYKTFFFLAARQNLWISRCFNEMSAHSHNLIFFLCITLLSSTVGCLFLAYFNKGSPFVFCFVFWQVFCAGFHSWHNQAMAMRAVQEETKGKGLTIGIDSALAWPFSPTLFHFQLPRLLLLAHRTS